MLSVHLSLHRASYSCKSSDLRDMLQLVLSRRDWRLRSLDLSSLNLLSLPPSLLTPVLCGLEEVNLQFARLSLAQLTGLATGVTASDRLALARLDLSGVDLSGVGAELLCGAVSRLTQVNLTGTSLSQDSLVSLFTALHQAEELGLEYINLSYSRLSAMPPAVLSEVVNKLHRVNLHATHLTGAQTETLLSEMVEMEELDIGYNDLSSVPPGLLASSLCRVSQLNITGCCLSTHQINGLFQSIVSTDQNIRLRTLQISNNNLSSVSPDTLTKVAQKLDEVNFNQTCLSSEQVLVLQQKVPADQLKARGEDANDCSLLRGVDNLLENHLAKYKL